VLKRYLKLPLDLVGFLAFQPILLLLWLLPFNGGSWLGKWLFGTIGPHLKVNAVARRNLKIVLGALEPLEERRLLKAMWQNLGRTLFEYIKLPTLIITDHPDTITIEGLEHLEQLLKHNQQGLLFTAHLGNWELGTHLAQQRGLQLAQVTRFLNNPFLRWQVNSLHQRIVHTLIPKGPQGAKQIMQFLKEGGHVSMLADQKLNDGIKVPLFGQEAMTAPAWARMALKNDCLLVPFYAVRVEGTKFKIVYETPLELPQEGDLTTRVYQVTRMMNERIEAWVRAYPEQWFWIHKRFPKTLYQTGDQ
jgi:KDO2-lipid IV(A) lauroyltransferase